MSSAETTRTNGESSIAWNGFTIQRSNVSTLLIAWPQGTSGEEVSSDWREFHEAPLPIPLPTPSSWGKGIHHWAWW